MIDFFLQLYRPTQRTIESPLEMTSAWKVMSRKIQLLHQMHTLARSINPENPKRKEVLLALGQLTSKLIADSGVSPNTV
jgi:uncharacterized protein YjiS (DUF1127 family)